jgi:hypothetical protein
MPLFPLTADRSRIKDGFGTQRPSAQTTDLCIWLDFVLGNCRSTWDNWASSFRNNARFQAAVRIADFCDSDVTNPTNPITVAAESDIAARRMRFARASDAISTLYGSRRFVIKSRRDG